MLPGRLARSRQVGEVLSRRRRTKKTLCPPQAMENVFVRAHLRAQLIITILHGNNIKHSYYLNSLNQVK